jgi:hypothetical protein
MMLHIVCINKLEVLRRSHNHQQINVCRPVCRPEHNSHFKKPPNLYHSNVDNLAFLPNIKEGFFKGYKQQRKSQI